MGFSFLFCLLGLLTLSAVVLLSLTFPLALKPELPSYELPVRPTEAFWISWKDWVKKYKIKTPSVLRISRQNALLNGEKMFVFHILSLHLTSVPVRFFFFSFFVFVFLQWQSVKLTQMAKAVGTMKSCRLVLQRAPVGSISVNTTFHLEPPAWQACLSAHLFLASCFVFCFLPVREITRHAVAAFFFLLFLEVHNRENKSLRSVTSSTTTSGELVELRMWSQDRFSDKDSFIKLSELPRAASPWPWHATRNQPSIPGVSDRVLKACRFIVTITWLSVSSFHPVLPDCRTSLQQLSSFL